MVGRSPSPNTLRAQNPTPRTPDSSCAAHKKIPWVNPLGTQRHHLIHSNAQELPQREPGSRGQAASPGHKENEARGRSPASPTPCSKGATKNFMAPTISASSKVIAASPRRRVLSERNDATRSSLNSSSITDSVESLGSLGFNAKSRGVYSSQDDLDLSHVRRWESEVESGELHVPHPAPPPPPPPLHVSHSPASANTSLPPYDPETNYLSPRPRFLHYKPKPRADPEDGKHLEDSFSCESCEDSPERSEDAQSSVTRKSLEVKEVEEECETSSPIEVEIGESTGSEKIIAHSSEMTKSRTFFLTKFATFLVLLIIACFCTTITDTPLIPSPTSLTNRDLANNFAPTLGELKDPSVGNYLSREANFGGSVLEEFAKLSHRWSANFVQRFSTIPPQEERGLFHPVNLTSMHSVGLDSDMDKASEAEVDDQIEHEGACEAKEPFAVVTEVFGDADDGRGINYLNDGSHEELEVGFQIVGSDGYRSQHQSVALEVMVEEGKAEFAIAEPEVSETESPKIDAEINDEEEQHGNEEIIDLSLPVVVESAAEAEEEKADDGVLEPSIEEDAAVELKSGDIKPPKIEPECTKEIGGEEEEVLEVEDGGPAETGLGVTESAGLEEQVVGDDDIDPSADAIRSKYPWGIMLLALSTSVVAIAAAAMMSFYGKKSRPSSSSAKEKMTTQPPKGTTSQKSTCVPDSSCSNMQFQTQQVVVLHGDDYPTEIETLHESGPAASSSLHNPSLTSRKSTRKVVEEVDVLSHEGKPRRDSTASSSSSASASFGSFTTYEKRSGKKGGQEEVMTPVRRSSRIRNQQTSP